MGPRISLLLVLVILLTAVCRAAEPSVDVAPLLQLVTEKSSLVAEWERAARLQMFLTIAGIVFGGLITVLQPWSSSTWCKVAAGLLGVAAAAITGLISKAPVSYATYERSALQARAKIGALNDNIFLLKTTSDPDGQRALRAEFMRTVREIHQLHLKLSGDDKPVAFLREPIGVVYAQSAQSKAPGWVTTLPVSSSDLYFRGEAESRLLSAAQANSLQDALELCTKHLLSLGKSVPLGAARQYAKTSTAVADTFFSYDGRTQTFRYYTLLRLDKSLARPEVVATLSRAMPESAPPSKVIVSGCSSMKVEKGELAAFRVREKLIYVYLAGQSQQIKLGTLHAPDKADIVVVTKPEIWTALLDALSSDRKPGAPPPVKTKVGAKVFDALRRADAQGYVENELENGRSFAVIVDGEKFVIRVETHYVKRYANVTVCPA